MRPRLASTPRTNGGIGLAAAQGDSRVVSLGVAVRVMSGTGRRRGRALVVGATAVAAASIAFAATSSGGGLRPAAPVRPAHERTMAEAMAILRTAQAHLLTAPKAPTAGATACPTSVPAVPFSPTAPCFPGRPGISAPNPALCPEPAPPAATWPGHPDPNSGYGIPFVAAVTNVRILAGYDAYVAANPSTNQTSTDSDYNNPWTVLVYNITGWVAGLLELPSLQAVIQPSQVVFCPPTYGPGANQCPSRSASTGCAWEVLWSEPGSWTKSSFSGDCTKAGTTLKGVVGACLPYIVTLAPDPTIPPKLTVLGLTPQGQLNVSASESASETLFAPASSEVCNGSNPTTVSLSTEPPTTPVPTGGPPAPPTGSFQGVPIPDLRVEQSPPAPITGPLRSISSTLSSNDFPVASFLPVDLDPHQNPTCNLWFLLDGELSGYNVQDTFNYDYHCGPFSPDPTHPLPCNPVAAPPGWAQATGQASVVYLGLPSQPPPGFSF